VPSPQKWLLSPLSGRQKPQRSKDQMNHTRVLSTVFFFEIVDGPAGKVQVTDWAPIFHFTLYPVLYTEWEKLKHRHKTDTNLTRSTYDAHFVDVQSQEEIRS